MTHAFIVGFSIPERPVLSAQKIVSQIFFGKRATIGKDYKARRKSDEKTGEVVQVFVSYHDGFQKIRSVKADTAFHRTP